MAETSAELATSATNTENKKIKKLASAGAKKPKSKPTHPPTAQMVNNAIKTLKERGGSSLPAIKKYLTANYKVDAEKLAPFIKKYLKSAVASGKLIQTKGKGASGSFKLASLTKVKSEGGIAGKKKLAVKKDKKAKKVVKSETRKSEKRVEKKKSVVSATKSAKKAGSPKAKPSKPKQQKPKKEKATKLSPKLPKAPKPKKLTAPKKAAVKKAAKK